jgi:predicted metal-dependent enzyme (double-stranded beta helix superfamily)
VIERVEPLERPSGRDLTGAELRTVATQVAARPQLWSAHVHHDPTRRTYAQLLRDAHLDVWLILWSEDHDTGFHDHDLSAGAVAVISGSVREERLVLGRPARAPIARTVRAGSSFVFGASDIHRVLHVGSEPAVTVHAYSPPLVRMGAYAIEPSGQLRRHTISYEQELRLLGSEPAAVPAAAARDDGLARAASISAHDRSPHPSS